METEKAIENLKKDIATPLACGECTICCIEDLETILKELEKKDKIIDLMALAISSYDGQLVINQYKDRNEVKEKFEEYAIDGTYERYFENKANEEVE